MIYTIAGLNVEIHGNSQMNKSTVVFEKSPDSGIYTRTNKAYPSEKRELLPSEEISSSDGISVYNDENEQFSKLKSEYLHAEICGAPCDDEGNSLYVLRRLSAYKAGAAQSVLAPDFRIQYKILPIISAPCGEYLGDLRGFSFYKENTGLCLIKQIPEIDEILVKMTFSEVFDSAEIELFDVSGLGGLSLDDRIHSYVGEAFAYLALKHGRVVFHSSAISCDGLGVCFSAPSGTGKSTHTGLWRTHYEDKTEIINDDTPVLYVNSNTAVLCGTPWSGKTELNINKQVPLKGIVFLERSKENYIKKLSGLETLRSFFSEAKIPQIPELFDAGISVAGKLLENVPVYLLGCNISKDAVDLVKNTLKM